MNNCVKEFLEEFPDSKYDNAGNIYISREVYDKFCSSNNYKIIDVHKYNDEEAIVTLSVYYSDSIVIGIHVLVQGTTSTIDGMILHCSDDDVYYSLICPELEDSHEMETDIIRQIVEEFEDDSSSYAIDRLLKFKYSLEIIARNSHCKRFAHMLLEVIDKYTEFTNTVESIENSTKHMIHKLFDREHLSTYCAVKDTLEPLKKELENDLVKTMKEAVKIGRKCLPKDEEDE